VSTGAAAPARLPADLHVLVAEDDTVNAQVTMAMLRRMGCRAWLVPDGAAAADAWRAGTFDVVLMDCQMPVMDGFAATRAIRGEERRDGRRPIPIVALTANAVAGDRDACLAAGMDHYLAKPFRLADLEAVLGRAVASRPNADAVKPASALG
jgi:two-component system, sensor histidine kinase and response regulator